MAQPARPVLECLTALTRAFTLPSMGRGTALLAGAGLAVVTVLAWCAPAGAVLDDNTVGCGGHATITGSDGKTYEADANDSTIKVPQDGSVAWQGSVQTVTHNHAGEIKVKIGPFDVSIDSWASKNESGQPSKSGTRDMPSALKDLPPGSYEISGHHKGDEGGCSGHATIEVQGSILGNTAGVVSVAGTVITGLGLGLAGVAKGRRR